jgi:hypothetical protein
LGFGVRFGGGAWVADLFFEIVFEDAAFRLFDVYLDEAMGVGIGGEGGEVKVKVEVEVEVEGGDKHLIRVTILLLHHHLLLHMLHERVLCIRDNHLKQSESKPNAKKTRISQWRARRQVGKGAACVDARKKCDGSQFSTR